MNLIFCARQTLLCLVAIAVLPLVGCQKEQAGPTGKKKGGDSAASLPSRAVKVAPVKHFPMERKVTVIGLLAAEEMAILSTKVAGRVDSVDVDLGTVVKKGQVVARMEPRDYELRVKQVEAQIAQARANLGLP